MADVARCAYISRYDGVLPDATGRDTVFLPEDGTPPATRAIVLDGLRPLLSITGAFGIYEVRLAPTDTSSKVRNKDVIQVQATFRTRVLSPGWTYDGVGVRIDDGVRHILIACGSRLVALDATTGDLLWDMGAVEPGIWHTLRVRKEATSGFFVELDGQDRGRVPYEFAVSPLDGSRGARVAFGHFDTTAGSTVRTEWADVDAALNMAVPPSWILDLQRTRLNPRIQQAWSVRHEAWLRSMMAAWWWSYERQQLVPESFTAARILTSSDGFQCHGRELPGVIDACTIEGDSSLFSVVRQRIRMERSVPAGTVPNNVPAFPGKPTLLDPKGFEILDFDTAAYEYDNGNANDSTVLGVGGFIGSYVGGADPDDRFYPDDAAAPHTWGFEFFEDNRFFDAAYQLQVYVEIYHPSRDDTDGHVLWVGVNPDLAQPDGVVAYRGGGVHHDGTPSVHAYYQNAGSSATPGESDLDMWMWMDSKEGAYTGAHAQVAGVDALGDEDVTSPTVNEGASNEPTSSYLIVQHGISEVRAAADTGSLLTFRIWTKLTVYGDLEGVRADIAALPNEQLLYGRGMYRAAATFSVVEFGDYEGDGRHVGPEILFHVGGRPIRARMIRKAVDGVDVVGWTIWAGADNGANEAVGYFWPVDPMQEHRVELIVFRSHSIMLVVDGRIVSEVEWADAFDTTYPSRHHAIIGRIEGMCTLDVRDCVFERWQADLDRRPWFEQRLAERGIPVGGCERNDRLEAWLERRHGVWEARGSEQGIITELQRLVCDDVGVITQVVPLDWYLEVSWPDEDGGVYLDADQDRQTTIYTFTTPGVEMTLEEIAAFAAEHVLPASTLEMTYKLAARTSTTSTWTYIPGDDAYLAYIGPGVPSPTVMFPVGSTVVISDGTTNVEGTVFSVATNEIKVQTDDDPTGFTSGVLVLRILATS